MKADISCSVMCKLKDNTLDLSSLLNQELEFDAVNREYEIAKTEQHSWDLGDVLSALFCKVSDIYMII